MSTAILSLVFLGTYVITVGIMMYVNTAVFNIGDPKFGEEGWMLYWPLWAVCYAPAAVAAVVAVWLQGMPPARVVVSFAVMLAILLATIELSALLDIHWTVLLVETVVLIAVFIWIARWIAGN